MEIKKILPPILVLIIFLAIWSLGAKIYDMAFLLPGPLTVAEAFIKDFQLVIGGLADLDILSINEQFRKYF